MSSLIKQIELNKIDDETVYLVHGFIHYTEKSLNIIIPEPIFLILMSFYYISEYFKVCGEGMKITDNFTVRASATGDCTAFGATIIPSNNDNTYIWKVKINGIATFGGLICIGIVDNKCELINDQYSTSDYDLYAVESGITSFKFIRGDADYIKQPFKGGDIIKLILNMKKQTFTVMTMNDNDPGITYTNVKKASYLDYKLAVTMRRLETSVTILNFRILYSE